MKLSHAWLLLFSLFAISLVFDGCQEREDKGNRKTISLSNQWKFINQEVHYANEGGSPGSAIRQGRYKLIKFYEDDHVEVYDLSVDIREENDISEDKTKITRKLLNKLDGWLERTDAKFSSPNPAYKSKALSNNETT